MRLVHIAAAIALTATPSLAFAQAAPAAKPAAGAHYSTDTPIGVLLADPAAKAVVAKYAPQIANSGNVDQMAQLTLKALQQFAPQVVTDQVLQNINYDLSKLPVKK